MRSTDHLRVVVGNSRVAGAIGERVNGSNGATLDTAISSSRVAAIPGRVLQDARSGADQSSILGLSRRAGATWLRATKTAVVVGVGRTVANWMRASLLYRWLTEEPETEVIVIDVRETLTVGSMIAGVDRVLEVLAPVREHHRLGRLVERTADRVPQEPIRAISLAVVTTAAVILGSTVVLGTSGPTGLVVWFVVGLLAVLGVHVVVKPDVVVRSKLVRLLLAAFEPRESTADDRPDMEAEDEERRPEK